MAAHRNIDRICVGVLICTVLLTLGFVNGKALGIQTASDGIGYENRLFEQGRVHTIDIVMDGWEDFIAGCEDEEYAACAVVIDGESYRNVGIRAKGNTSLSTVSSMGSDRYSFKIEFDQYDGAGSYYGLDKLSLNNMIQDTACMKDFLVYRMMDAFGVDAPLCSYAYLTVNGEDWGLYLAVEAVEDAFLQRNYGADHGALYKPDSMNFGGGRGNGMAFDMGDFMDASQAENRGGAGKEWSGPPENGGGPGGGGPSAAMPGGMGSGDVKLQYIDDDPDSYANIFDNAKTGSSPADQARLIQALKTLNGEDGPASAVNAEEVIRYFVVHNFVCNGDSYTGEMVHNYYLYEEDGVLSMIPWDYNLAFGTFRASDATETVNSPIDTPVSSGSTGDRPMVDWIFASEEHTELYRQYFSEFLASADLASLIDETAALIAPYVQKDPTKFYSYEEFEAGVGVLREFCLLRAESVSGQLAGTIPSTADGQAADASGLIDASHIDLSDMGSMGGGVPGESSGGFPGGGLPAEDGVPQPPDGSRQPLQPGEGQFTPPDRDGGGMPGNMPDMSRPAGGWALLAISAAVLLAAVIAAFKYKR